MKKWKNLNENLVNNGRRQIYFSYIHQTNVGDTKHNPFYQIPVVQEELQ